jgi:hypothetical protein
MHSDEEVRAFAEHYLSPTLRALVSLPPRTAR